ncbi:retrotransposon protein, putative, ty3-gypsy subclass [Tanacetum coccineum]
MFRSSKNITQLSFDASLHPGKANVVADALSRKSGMIACFDSMILHDLERLDVELCVRGSGGFWASMRIESNLMLQIKEAQRDDGELWAIVQNVEDGKHTEFSVDDDGIVWFEDRLCVPNDQALREKVMTEAHSSPFTIHPGSTKMYRDLKQYFWWNGMKQDVATFVSKCMTCQQVKIEHQRASGLLQPLEIPMWKWDEISMDFVTGLPTTQKRHDAIWVVVDRLTKQRSEVYVLVFGKDYRKLRESSLCSVTAFHPHNRMVQSERDHSDFGDMLRALCFRMDRFAIQRMLNVFGIKGASSVLDSLVVLRFGTYIWEVSYRWLFLAVIARSRCLYVSLLRGYISIHWHGAFILLIQIQSCLLSLSEEPESILDRQERVMRNKVIPFVKILWKNHPEREATWETEESMRASYPHFFV